MSPTITTKELCELVADKISLQKQRATFALYYLKNGEGRCLDEDEQPCKVIVQEVVGQDADFQKYIQKDEWAKLKKEWEKDSRLVYKIRVFLKHHPITKDDVEYLHYAFIQACANVRDGKYSFNCEIYFSTGTYPCSESAAMELAGLHMQVSFGDYNKKVHVTGFLKYIKSISAVFTLL